MDPGSRKACGLYRYWVGKGGTQTHSAELFKTGNKFEVMVSREYTSIRLRCHIDHEELCVAHFVDAGFTPI